MYFSVLIDTRDLSNNSRIARRLVLYDDMSEITIGTEKKLFFSSAVAETGYKWQTTSDDGNLTIIITKKYIYIYSST